mgnify:CR=1 FL=1|tara:strand:- start:52 stop:417 length:366 start_codon:yes stop_codon:yes gene_type:complete
MNKWVLLQHKIDRPNLVENHFDFLIENGKDCLTWKIFEIPQINGPPVEIIKQVNHRLIWLYREEYTLSNSRGEVQRKDNGTYYVVGDCLQEDEFSLVLNGKIFNGIFKKKLNLCHIISAIN